MNEKQRRVMRKRRQARRDARWADPTGDRSILPVEDALCETPGGILQSIWANDGTEADDIFHHIMVMDGKMMRHTYVNNRLSSSDYWGSAAERRGYLLGTVTPRAGHKVLSVLVPRDVPSDFLFALKNGKYLRVDAPQSGQVIRFLIYDNLPEPYCVQMVKEAVSAEFDGTPFSLRFVTIGCKVIGEFYVADGGIGGGESRKQTSCPT